MTEIPNGYVLTHGEPGWSTVSTRGMNGPKHRLAKLVMDAYGGVELQEFKGHPLAAAHREALQPWVDALNMRVPLGPEWPGP